MFIDTHTHLMDERFCAEDVVSSFEADGIDCVNAVGSSLITSRQAVELAARYPRVFAVVGVHPEEAAAFTSETAQEIQELAKRPKVVAVGEIGLDYHYDYPKALQREAFIRQLEIASAVGLPVVLHVRDAYEDALNLLTEYREKLVGGVMHCYSGSAEMVERFLKLGLYVSFAGSVTFKNNKKAEDCISRVPLDRVLTETDCPYLTPMPHRGEMNYPKYVRYVAEKLAEVYGIPLETLCAAVGENAAALFGIRG